MDNTPIDEKTVKKIKAFMELKGYNHIWIRKQKNVPVCTVYENYFIAVDFNHKKAIQNGKISNEEKLEFAEFKQHYFEQADTFDTYEDMLNSYCTRLCHYSNDTLYVSNGKNYDKYTSATMNKLLNQDEIIL